MSSKARDFITCIFVSLQHLEKTQKALGLTCVEDADIIIKPNNFDPQSTVVTMKFMAADIETDSWVPSLANDPLWIKDKKLFLKVSHVKQNLHKFLLFLRYCT